MTNSISLKYRLMTAVPVVGVKTEEGSYRVFSIAAVAETLSIPLPAPILRLIEGETQAKITTLEVNYECTETTDPQITISLLFHTYVYSLAGDKDAHCIDVILYRPENYYSYRMTSESEPPGLWNQPSFSENSAVSLSLTGNSKGFYTPSAHPSFTIFPRVSPIIRFLSVIRFEVHTQRHLLITRHVLKLGKQGSCAVEPAAWLELRERVIWRDKMYTEPGYLPAKLAELINDRAGDDQVLQLYRELICEHMSGSTGTEVWHRYEDICRLCGVHEVQKLEKAQFQLTWLWDSLLQSILSYHLA